METANMPAAIAAHAQTVAADLNALCERCHVQGLDLFGSATGPGFDPAASDLDFFVRFENLPDGTYAEAYFELRDGLAALFERDVELVTEAALRNPYFRRSVEAGRRRLYPP